MGPLDGTRVVELGGMGPVPFAGMLLADMGAEVVCVERHDRTGDAAETGCTRRGKQIVTLDLKDPDSVAALRRLIARAQVLIEGFRPGVTERLGIGPEVCLADNPRLVYGRMTGWGQTGPLAAAAGHDINYIALSGALHAIGRAGDAPVPPLNLVGDYGGGAMFLVVGVLAALLESQRSGQGQVIDTAMTDGSALLMALFHSLHAAGQWRMQRGINLLDGGAPFYDVYATADGKFVAVGALEPQFFAALCEKIGLGDAGAITDHLDPAGWPALREKLAAVFATRTRAEWCELLEGSDACFAPVLDLVEARDHSHHRARGTFVEVDGMIQPGPAPRFGRTPATARPAEDPAGGELLADWGLTAGDIALLRADRKTQ